MHEVNSPVKLPLDLNVSRCQKYGVLEFRYRTLYIAVFDGTRVCIREGRHKIRVQVYRAAYKHKIVAKHSKIINAYQNKVTSQTTMSHVQFETVSMSLLLSKTTVKQFFSA